MADYQRRRGSSGSELLRRHREATAELRAAKHAVEGKLNRARVQIPDLDAADLLAMLAFDELLPVTAKELEAQPEKAAT